jgi:hypothetical protein
MVYTIGVVTGDESRAVDTHVFISIQGAEGAILGFQLDEQHSTTGHKHLFEAGQEDIFKCDHDQIGKIDVVQVYHDPISLEDSWYLNSISVKDNSGTEYSFPCSNWLSSTMGDGREARTLLSGPLMGDLQVHGLQLMRSSTTSSTSTSHYLSSLNQTLPSESGAARRVLEKEGILRTTTVYSYNFLHTYITVKFDSKEDHFSKLGSNCHSR